MADDPDATPARPTSPDLTYLVESLDDPELVQAVIGTFLSALPGRLSAIVVARQAPDEESVRAAHSLRSSSAMLGLTALADSCGRLEAALRAGPSTPAPALVDLVLEHADHARHALSAATDAQQA